MTAKPIKRRHHYLPQWYLKGFTKNGAKKSILFCINLGEKKKFETNPSKVGVLRDFNRINNPKSHPDMLENALAICDSDINKIIRNIEKEEVYNSLKSEHKKGLLYFLALITIRTPYMRKHRANNVDKFYKQTFRTIASVPAGSKCNGQVITQEFKNFVNNDSVTFEITRDSQIRQEFKEIDVILPLLHKRKWIVFKTTDEMPFITSDEPAMLWWSDKNIGGIGSPGFALTNTTMLMPLTKNMVLIGSFELEKDLGYVTAKKEFVAEVNTNIFHFAQQFVYSPIREFWFKKQDGSLSCDVDSLIS